MRKWLLSTSMALTAGLWAPQAGAFEPSLDMLLRGLAPDSMEASLRVVGGTSTSPEVWPWQVYLIIPAQGDFVSLCGGSLIAPRWVLTAAHCFNEWRNGAALTVVEGMRSIDPKTLGNRRAKREFRTSKVYFDSYDKETSTNDIALIELPDAAESKPVPLQLTADKTFESPGRITTITGWGVLHSVKKGANGAMIDSQTGQKLSETQFRTSTLMQVELPIVDTGKCQAIYKGGDGVIDQRNLCAGVEEGGKDSCQGDSGGPMVTQAADGSYRQIGVVSWGSGCARVGIPGIYTRVSAFSGWIKGKVGKDLVVADNGSPVPEPAPVPAKPVTPPPKPAVAKPVTPPALPSQSNPPGTQHGGPPAEVAANPPPAPAPAPPQANPPAETPDPAPGPAADPAPNPKPTPSAAPVDNNPGGLAVSIDAGDNVRIGQKISFSVTAARQGYVTLLDRAPDGSLTLIYPTEISLRTPTGAKEKGTLTPGKALVVPDKRNPYAGFEYQIDPPAGEGMLVAVLSDAPLSPSDIPGGPKTFKARPDARALIGRLGSSLRASIKLRADGEPEKPEFSVIFHPYTISP